MEDNERRKFCFQIKTAMRKWTTGASKDAPSPSSVRVGSPPDLVDVLDRPERTYLIAAFSQQVPYPPPSLSLPLPLPVSFLSLFSFLFPFPLSFLVPVSAIFSSFSLSFLIEAVLCRIKICGYSS